MADRKRADGDAAFLATASQCFNKGCGGTYISIWFGFGFGDDGDDDDDGMPALIADGPINAPSPGLAPFRTRITEMLAHAQQRKQQGEAHHTGGPVEVLCAVDDALHSVDQRLRMGNTVAQDMFELGEPDQDRRRRGKPGDNGMGEEVDDETKAERSEEDLEDADKERQRDGQLEVALGLCLIAGKLAEP